METIAPSNNGIPSDARFLPVVRGERSCEEGKDSTTTLNEVVISLNEAMLKEIALEKARLCDIAIFFTCVDLDKCPHRKFLDD